MIEIDHLHKRFGDFVAVEALSFTVRPGEVLGFLGPNGAGKTTTMRMITGFLHPDRGTVRVFGHDIRKAPLQAKAKLGYLPEGAPAYGEMTPLAFLDFVARVRGLRGPDRRRRIDEVVQRLALERVLHQPIDTLSKGFKRRVGLAQAILHRPPALILDEPTDGLDPNQKYEVRQLIQELAENSLIIVSTHILEEVSAVCTRALIIARGRILADGTPAELERRSRYHGAVCVKLPGGLPPDLALLPGLAGVEHDPRIPERCWLIPEAGVDLYPRVRDFIAERGVAVEELTVERGRLDEVFQRLTGFEPLSSQGRPAVAEAQIESFREQENV
ncbi:ABC-2 type transport system ATP-binding protein [Methylomarinovum tepidoasis]|uniref:ABC-2 type transport system ATP-binding protein n=1 Tax=Methylomarinovum tepidoasis TaxID=2840183 RepID=A0AAU9D382_9GAMM|nr:ABC transporter ATP-binding protein [Methylomarinovum sp. IN45]BCX89424.1 ABC-2 type transport system ATP-binding protein [Methylomarinovum sp. IN45]